MERKLQRRFRRGDACRLIQRGNDFGAGGVSVAVGELADGLYNDLDMVTKKYDGLDGTELAISESQERMAVAAVEVFMGYAAEENLEATVIAVVTCEPRVRMAWQGDAIVDLSRDFLNSNGAPKYQDVHVVAQGIAPIDPESELVTCEPRVRMAWQGDAIVDLSRDFLNSNGAPKYQDVHVVAQGIAPIDPESELAEAALEEFGTLDGIYESTVPMVPGAETCESFRDAMTELVSDLNVCSLEEFGTLDGIYESTVPMVPGAETCESFRDAMTELVSDLNVCSNKGLSERFDSTIGAATVLMPFGGERQLTPSQAMVAKFPVDGETTTVSGMAWGFNPYIMDADQYRGAYLSVVESISRLVATGFDHEKVYLSFQEYFERLRDVPERWGKPMAAVLGALLAQVELGAGAIGGNLVATGFDHEKVYLSFQEYFERLRDVPERWGKPMAAVLGALLAQVELGAGAIGGKDSRSGSFEDLDVPPTHVPPTLVSFAVAVDKLANVVSPEFKGAGHRVALIQPSYQVDDLLPESTSLLAAFGAVEGLVREGKALSVSTAGFGGLAEVLFKACLGNRIGFEVSEAYYEADARDLFDHSYGCFVVELAEGAALPEVDGACVVELGVTCEPYELTAYGETLDLDELQEAWESALEGVFPYRSATDDVDAPEELIPEERYRCEEEGRIRATYGGLKIAKPRVIIPVFPGNNCEFDSARAFRAAGAEADVFVINNLTPENVAESTRELARRIRESQIVMIPGGFSGGDEPDGSAKFDDVDAPEELIPEERSRCEEEGHIRATYGGLKIAQPRVILPVFPGTNCEFDSARAFRAAGAEADVFVINNLTPENVAESTRERARRIRESQIVMIPGGFSGGDEPDGSAKFITAFFRAPEVAEAVRDLMQARDGLMLGICNGFPVTA